MLTHRSKVTPEYDDRDEADNSETWQQAEPRQYQSQ